ncbi:hypothetical protein ACQ5SP_05710 [Rhodovulum sp. YNF3179]|uniref:hypothetical protein n=1 Tax=Rhodovulum sp. YNF3179 TaxID=3425127 RepID=UPI003D324D77
MALIDRTPLQHDAPVLAPLAAAAAAIAGLFDGVLRAARLADRARLLAASDAALAAEGLDRDALCDALRDEISGTA